MEHSNLSISQASLNQSASHHNLPSYRVNRFFCTLEDMSNIFQLR